MKQTILAISGKPGLYKLVSRATNSLIVEALDETHKRMPAFGTDRITSLADIAMFTETEDVPLMKVLASMRDLEKGKESSVSCPNGIRTVYRTAISRNSSSGITFSLKLASQTLKKRWHLPRVTILMTEKKINK